MDALEKAIEAKNLILVIGTGVAAATAPSAPVATWMPLIRSGVERVVGLVPARRDEWQPLVESMLAYGSTSSTPDVLINAASMVKAELLKVGAQAYAAWLKESVGSLAVEDRDVAESIVALPFPILTTNYDTLLEEVADRSAIHWGEPRELQQILGGSSNAIGHLHGVWSIPESVIFSLEDYTRVGAAQGAQELQRAVSSIKSLVYIGFGSGLHDPNLGKLLEWHRETFPNSGIEHYRLCLDSEFDELQGIHARDNIVPVPYGTKHSDLPGYLRRLGSRVAAAGRTDAGIVRDIVQDARDALLDLLAADLVLADAASEHDRMVEDLLLPPALLPVPHAEYVRAKNAGAHDITKIAAVDELNETEFVVLAAESENGLTTALRWLAWKSSEDLGTAAPICISFRECPRGSNPLERQVLQSARGLGLVARDATELPAHVLAIDDMNPAVTGIFDRVMASAAKAKAVVTYIGCRQGDEDVIVERLKQAGHDPRLRYLSRLGDSDVAALVARAHPASPIDLTNSVISVLRGENLPRTPFSVSLLIQVLMRGGAIGASASQTVILDQYVSMLLGRGDPHEDARFTIDQSAREALLAHLAESLARQRLAGVDEDEVTLLFKQTMALYDWPDSASSVLRHLIALKVLRRSGHRVEFARSSFLFLFAAKRAAASTDFREFLLQDALYFAPVLQDHAALVRNDGQTLVRVLAELPDADEVATDRSPYEVLEPVDAPPAPEPEPETSPADVSGSNALTIDDYDDTDRLPFPVDATENLTLVRRLMRSLDLVSRVLRDSDQISVLEHKDDALYLVLERWGQLVSVIHQDAQFREVVYELVAGILDSSEEGRAIAENPVAVDEFSRAMSRIFPAAMIGGGIEATLASRKLLLSLQRGLNPAALGASDESALAACLFAFSLGEAGWPADVRRVLAERGNFWLAPNFLYPLFRDVLTRNESLSADDERELVEVCVEIFARAYRYDSERAKVLRLDDLRAELRRDRRLALARARPVAGVSAAKPTTSHAGER